MHELHVTQTTTFWQPKSVATDLHNTTACTYTHTLRNRYTDSHMCSHCKFMSCAPILPGTGATTTTTTTLKTQTTKSGYATCAQWHVTYNVLVVACALTAPAGSYGFHSHTPTHTHTNTRCLYPSSLPRNERFFYFSCRLFGAFPLSCFFRFYYFYFRVAQQKQKLFN